MANKTDGDSHLGRNPVKIRFSSKSMFLLLSAVT